MYNDNDKTLLLQSYTNIAIHVSFIFYQAYVKFVLHLHTFFHRFDSVRFAKALSRNIDRYMAAVSVQHPRHTIAHVHARQMLCLCARETLYFRVGFGCWFLFDIEPMRIIQSNNTSTLQYIQPVFYVNIKPNLQSCHLFAGVGMIQNKTNYV